MTKGEEIVKTWEHRQTIGRYTSYDQSMADLAALIDSCIVKPKTVYYEPIYEPSERDIYRKNQADLRAAGFDAYNCDMVDEFPRW